MFVSSVLYMALVHDAPSIPADSFGLAYSEGQGQLVSEQLRTLHSFALEDMFHELASSEASHDSVVAGAVFFEENAQVGSMRSRFIKMGYTMQQPVQSVCRDLHLKALSGNPEAAKNALELLFWIFEVFDTKLDGALDADLTDDRDIDELNFDQLTDVHVLFKSFEADS